MHGLFNSDLVGIVCVIDAIAQLAVTQAAAAVVLLVIILKE